MIIYFKEILYILGDDRRIFPVILILFVGMSLFDLLGLGLVGAYIGLIVSPGTMDEGILKNFTSWLNLSLDQNEMLIIVGFFLIAVFLFKTIGSLLINYMIIVICSNNLIRIQSFLMQAYLQMPYSEYLKRNSAEYIITIQSHTGAYSQLLLAGLRTVSDSISGIAILGLLAITNGPAFCLLVFLLGILIIGYDRIFRNKLRDLGRLKSEAFTRLVQGIQEGVMGLKEIRILGKEKYFQQTVSSAAKDIGRYSVHGQMLSMSPRFFIEFIMVLFIVSMVLFAVFYSQDLMPLMPEIGVFGVGALRLLPSANVISNFLVNLRTSRYAVSRLYNDLAMMKNLNIKKIKERTTANLEPFKTFIMDKVDYSYPNTDIKALNQISLELNAGQSIGLIGASGSGKTTVLDVLLGLLKPQEGAIRYNMKSLNECLSEWRSEVAYLPQDVFLIDNTLRQNVALGVEISEIDENRVYESLRRARLEELVEQLPQGVDTHIGERGLRLSGGQRQRVSLARAFYHGRNVLVLDEATSSLDDKTEREIVEEIRHLKGKKTLIVIAHRLSTVQHCDWVFRLDNGRIVQQGTYINVVSPQKRVVNI